MIMTWRAAAMAAAMASAMAGCTIGAPPGFSGGSSWVFPLVGPLEGGPLVVPVTINGKGPYLFMIDPDAPLSSVDEGIVSENQLYSGMGPEFIDESDTQRQTRLAEVKAIGLGTLTVRNRSVFVHKVGTYFAGGRAVRGVLGRDVLADSLVFGFDRDAGVGYLATQGSFNPPAGAARIGYDLKTSRRVDGVRPVSRRLINVDIDGKRARMHLDLGASTSTLAATKVGGLAQIPLKTSVIDEVGSRRTVDHASVANSITVGPVTASAIALLPFVDKRWDELDFDGTLGLDVFARHAVWANFDDDALFVVPRGDVAASTQARIKRWNSVAIDACVDPACTRAALVVEEPVAPPPAEPLPPAEPPPGLTAPVERTAPPPEAFKTLPTQLPTPAGPPVLRVERDAAVQDLAFEVLVEAVDRQGKPLGLPRLLVILDVGQTAVSQRLDPAFGDVAFRVLDVSPFVRPCPGGAPACVFQLTATP